MLNLHLKLCQPNLARQGANQNPYALPTCQPGQPTSASQCVHQIEGAPATRHAMQRPLYMDIPPAHQGTRANTSASSAGQAWQPFSQDGGAPLACNSAYQNQSASLMNQTMYWNGNTQQGSCDPNTHMLQQNSSAIFKQPIGQENGNGSCTLGSKPNRNFLNPQPNAHQFNDPFQPPQATNNDGFTFPPQAAQTNGGQPLPRHGQYTNGRDLQGNGCTSRESAKQRNDAPLPQRSAAPLPRQATQQSRGAPYRQHTQGNSSASCPPEVENRNNSASRAQNQQQSLADNMQRFQTAVEASSNSPYLAPLHQLVTMFSISKKLYESSKRMGELAERELAEHTRRKKLQSGEGNVDATVSRSQQSTRSGNAQFASNLPLAAEPEVAQNGRPITTPPVPTRADMTSSGPSLPRDQPPEVAKRRITIGDLLEDASQESHVTTNKTAESAKKRTGTRDPAVDVLQQKRVRTSPSSNRQGASSTRTDCPGTRAVMDTSPKTSDIQQTNQRIDDSSVNTVNSSVNKGGSSSDLSRNAKPIPDKPKNDLDTRTSNHTHLGSLQGTNKSRTEVVTGSSSGNKCAAENYEQFNLHRPTERSQIKRKSRELESAYVDTKKAKLSTEMQSSEVQNERKKSRTDAEIKTEERKTAIEYSLKAPETVMGNIESRTPRRIRKLKSGVHASTQTPKRGVIGGENACKDNSTRSSTNSAACCIDNPVASTRTSGCCIDDPIASTSTSGCCMDNPIASTSTSGCCIDNPIASTSTSGCCMDTDSTKQSSGDKKLPTPGAKNERTNASCTENGQGPSASTSCGPNRQGTSANISGSSMETDSSTTKDSPGAKEVKKESETEERPASPHQMLRDFIKQLAANAGHEVSEFVIDSTIDILKREENLHRSPDELFDLVLSLIDLT